MNLPDALLPLGWEIAAWVPLLAAWVFSLRLARWRQLADSEQLNVMLGMIVVLALLWSLKAGVRPGLNFHLLGAAVFVLAFGPWLATLGLSAVLAAVTLNGAAAWSAYALNALIMVLVPVWVSYGIFRLADRRLPNHLFVFIFVNGFLGAGLAAIAAGLAASLLLLTAGVYPGDYLWNEYLPYYLLLGFSEAWLSGMAITLMVIYRPAWVGTFDDSRYLAKK
jgi:uncharacterized membrane protein